MELSWPIVIVGTALGILQLGVGVVLGRALPWGSSKPQTPEPVGDDGPEADVPEMQPLRTQAARLGRLVANLANVVDRHQIRIEQITREVGLLEQDRAKATSDCVLHRLSEIEQANRQFRQRLHEAEDALREHARQINRAAPDVAGDDSDLESVCRDVRSRLAEL
ncbi:MAG: hypothetical protein NTW96_06240 [Planctomycetia bacterium]|nr:hypothetical protein [Planctomycetia bacterium]